MNFDYLLEDFLQEEKIKKEPTRDGFGRGLVRAGEEDERVVVLCADLAESTRVHWFKEKFPERYVEIGVAEQNLAAIASGLANYGKIPFIASYAAFSPGRNNEQIRTAISLSELPVKVVGAHAGVSVGPDGATHQALEDIALMRVQPNMNVVVPCDSNEAEKLTYLISKTDKPAYIRLGREKTPLFTKADANIEIGKAILLKDGKDVTIFACGQLVYYSLLAANELEAEEISVAVVNNHTIKPLDKELILKMAKQTNAVVTAEEHQIAGGMGSAILEFLSSEHPVFVEMVGVKDRFGQSGNPDELLKEYELDKESIKNAVKRVIKKKNK